MTPEPALAPPAAPPSLELGARLRPRRRQLGLGLGLGLLGALLLDGTPFGVAHALFGLSLATALAGHTGREAWQQAREHRWLLVGATLLFASTMLHTATWLAVMSVLAALLLFALAILGWPGERPLATLRPRTLLGAPFLAFGQSVYAGAVVASREFEQSSLTASLRRYAPAALRLVAIVVPPVLLLLVLLSSGDVVFRA
ncbi:MAG: DUF4153 domain-containing protein, partial [Myxococcota bacterium]